MAQRRWQIELMGVNLTTRGQESEINREVVMNKNTALKWRCVFVTARYCRLLLQ